MIIPIPDNKVPIIGQALRGSIGTLEDTDEQLIRKFIYETLKGKVNKRRRQTAADSTEEFEID